MAVDLDGIASIAHDSSQGIKLHARQLSSLERHAELFVHCCASSDDVVDVGGRDRLAQRDAFDVDDNEALVEGQERFGGLLATWVMCGCHRRDPRACGKTERTDGKEDAGPEHLVSVPVSGAHGGS